MATVSQYILAQLREWGIDSLYGVVGDTYLQFMDELSQQKQISFYATQREDAAGFMASAEAKLTGKVGTCMATSGPGIANLLNGIGDAALDRVPLLAITGQVPTDKIGTDYKQYVDQQLLVQPLADYSTLVAHPQSIPMILPKALRLAEQGMVAHLSIPKDIFAQNVTGELHSREPLTNLAPQPDPRAIEEGIQRINQCQRPIILAGHGARTAAKQVMELAEKIGAPMIQALEAKGMIPGNHPLYLGGLGQGGSEPATQMLTGADLVLIIGSTWWPQQYTPKTTQVIQLDSCPTNIGGGHPALTGVVGDVTQTLPVILAGVKGQPRSSWTEKANRAQQAWMQQLSSEWTDSQTPMHPSRIIHTIEEQIAPDAIVTLDVGDHVVWFNRAFQGGNQQVVVSGTWRSMGFGIPAANAAKKCYPDRQVVAVVGDGGAMMSFAELLTARRYNWQIVVVVLKNQALTMEKNRMVVGNLNPTGVDLTTPDFAALARACGCYGVSVNEPGQLGTALREALNCGQPAVVEVATAQVMAPHTDPNA